ncbi:histidine--tRNA ligase [Ruminiclostridium herbifermentans]|uniref:Histidine--tRNA ligase n=1 Tax=Ruminiclostridium herbifermentans TaxID=2488810 RepID=A0A4V6EN86_9FIRM|nr:histidine--tRNA ligase [Ruminiclostridium herbifermentans]QNU65573.1 histidine--tRNA ligase [Ruminiclostridium herbifermentans]
MTKQIVTPSILPGFMELLPADQIVFNNMLDTIKKNYEKYGFIPVDTPMIEKSEVLLAKGGGETEKQIYRFNKGDNDLSLRFDLTVPLARFVAQHFGELTFPFKRYHIGKVFRGEKPQKGRFREFYQCDIDIIGNESLSVINDAEILSVIYSTFKALGFDDFTIRINNRKILNGFFESIKVSDKTEVLRTIDKLEKIGNEAVAAELKTIGLSDKDANSVLRFVGIKGSCNEILKSLKELGIENDTFAEGVKELEEVLNYIAAFKVPVANYTVDLTIARGLDYYTGTIYETILNQYPSIGSVCSGGRYDNLAQNYTNKKLPGVGISIGLTRLFYQLRAAGVVGGTKKATTSKILVIPMQETMAQSLELSTKLREADIPTEIYFNEGKMGKKFSYADKLGIPYVIVVGEDEVKAGKFKLKNMETGEQIELELEQIIEKLKS